MDLALTEEQEMLKTAVRGFIQVEYPKETLLEMAAEEQPVTAEPWQRLVATGWLGIAMRRRYWRAVPKSRSRSGYPLWPGASASWYLR